MVRTSKKLKPPELESDGWTWASCSQPSLFR